MAKEYIVAIDETGSTWKIGPELIRCKDCRYHREEGTFGAGSCMVEDGCAPYRPDDGYCSLGKRPEE